MLRSINPATGEVIQSYSLHTTEELSEIFRRSKEAFSDWRACSIESRVGFLRNLETLLLKRREELALLMTEEMGKPLKPARAEIEKCAWVCRYYANEGECFLKSAPIETEFYKSFIAFEPLGGVLGIMPWNFPFWQVFRYGVPTLLAGNVTLLKHASNVTGCSLKIQELFEEAGFPQGVFQSLRLMNADMEEVIASPFIQAVTLTGSTKAGRAVASTAGKYLKKCVLELGGSDPYVILSDADLEQVIPACLTARFQNTGQSCIAAKRFIVETSRKVEFETRLKVAIEKLKMGDPRDESNELGPLVHEEARTHLHDQVQRALQAGADLVLGGKIPEGRGAFYPPTLLTNVKPGNPAFDEELFGPVAVIIEASTNDEAVRLANQSSFGLGAALFSKDLGKAEALARKEIQAGSVFVNAFVRSDPRLPFGGIKDSGYGRELSSFGIREFVNIKTIVMES